MNSISDIKGMVIPLPTPFLENGELDERVLEELVSFYVRAEVNALFVAGSFGQGPAMNIEQRKRVTEIVVARIAHQIPVMIHVGAVDPYTSIELAVHARSLDADAVAIVGPYYYSDHSEFEIIEHFRMVDAEAKLPILVYNNAEYSGYKIPPAMMARLVEAVPRIFGMKLAKGTIAEAQRYLRAIERQFSIFAPPQNAFPGVLVGIRGTISPVLSAFPELGIQLFRAIDGNNLSDATKLQTKILEFLSAYSAMSSVYGRSVQKEALRLRGFDIKLFPRYPVKPLPEEVRIKLREGLERAGMPGEAIPTNKSLAA
jgi:dihydrodipicolinate synthase/N-acetylneuraminate lyase